MIFPMRGRVVFALDLFDAFVGPGIPGLLTRSEVRGLVGPRFDVELAQGCMRHFVEAVVPFHFNIKNITSYNDRNLLRNNF